MVNLFKYKIKFLLLLLLFSFSSVCAQENEDFGTSLSAGISKRFFSHLDLGIEEEFRFNNNSTDFERWATSVDLSYILCKKVFKVGVDYDLICDWVLNQEGFDYKHRFNAYFVLKHDIYRFNISWKSRFQSTYRNSSTGDYVWNPKNYWRNKLNLSYNIRKSKITPYVALEVFYRPDYYEGHFVDCLRYEGGLAYKISKKQKIDLCFKYDYEINVNKPQRMSRLCLSYGYEF